MAKQILIIDDERAWLDILVLSFSEAGWEVETAFGGESGWLALDRAGFDLVLCDLAMPDLSGLDLLKRLRAAGNNVPFIVMTGVGTIRTAVEAMQFGAYNYVTKPFKTRELLALAEQAASHGRMHRALDAAESGASFPMVLGGSASLRNILGTMSKVAASTASVLIEGETGTGKSMLARVIHESSPRRDLPMLTIDCGALPESLLESELFGHVRGSFTGALNSRRGLLAEAQGGTVFLDEIGEMPLALQAKLLRAVQEKEVRPVGGNASLNIDVRFISATNRDLRQAVKSGTFREDLYYRLAVVPCTLPPLRERREDIILFIGHFVRKYNEVYAKNIREVSPAALGMLLAQPWPGNVRQLENLIERVVLLSEGRNIAPSDLGPLDPPVDPESSGPPDSFPPGAGAPAPDQPPISLHQAVLDAEKKAVSLALTMAGGNRRKAAELLGISRRTLYHKLDEHGI